MEVTFHHYCHILLIRNRSQVPSTFKERVLEKGRIPEVGDHWGPCGAAYHREQKGRVDIYFFYSALCPFIFLLVIIPRISFGEIPKGILAVLASEVDM